MALLDLPLELLDEIIDLTLPSGIEGLALCCKAVHTRAASQIQRHNSLKQQWKHTTISNHHRAYILRILYEISCDPLVGQYIESLSLWDRTTVAQDSDDAEFPLTEDVKRSIKDMFLRSECFDDAGIDRDEWCEQLWTEYEKGREDEGRGEEHALHTTVSLLGELPNLRTLQLPPGWYDRSRQYERDEEQQKERSLVSMLDAMVKSSNRDNNRGKALGKLESILPSMEEGYEERAPFQNLEPLFGLKSLKELYVTSCLAIDDGYTGSPFRWRNPELNSSLRRVELTSCTMDEEGLCTFLSHTPFLEVFRYSHETKWHGCLHDWNAGAFIEAIGTHCGQTITNLAVTIDSMYGDIIHGAESFRAFPKLRNLEIDLGIFYGPPAGRFPIGIAAGGLPEGEVPWTLSEIPRLGDMLPESVVDVQINTDFKGQDSVALEVLLNEFPELRASRLKELERLTIRQYRRDSARVLAKKAGAKLSVFNHINTNRVRRDMMPAWKREFERRVGELQESDYALTRN